MIMLVTTAYHNQVAAGLHDMLPIVYDFPTGDSPPDTMHRSVKEHPFTCDSQHGHCLCTMKQLKRLVLCTRDTQEWLKFCAHSG